MKKTFLSLFILVFLSGVLFTPFSTVSAQSNGSSGGANAIVDGASCLGSQVVSKSITSAISGLLSKVSGAVTDAIGLSVPAHETGQVLANSNVDTAAHTGGGFSIFGVNINLLPSWDAIAYCIGNALITYVADSVTNWINSGFNGNPSFVDNPSQFFSDIADQTAGSFVQNLIQGATGINICEPFRISVGLSTLDGYNSNFGSQSSCTLQEASENMQGFLSGDPEFYSVDAMYAATQNPANNYWGSTIMANNELNLQIYTESTLARDMLQRNGGYRDVQDCQYSYTYDAQGNQIATPVPGTCKTTVTGADVQKAGQDSRNMANLRLVAATKFDQVVTALVNQLIKVALNKLLTTSSGQ